MKNLVDKLNELHSKYEECVDVDAAEHITGSVLNQMNYVCRNLMTEITNLMEKL